MPTGRLYQQFQRLAQQLGCDERETSLAEVADLLCCTPRNARLLLRRQWRASVIVALVAVMVLAFVLRLSEARRQAEQNAVAAAGIADEPVR